jgi:hypothetical protein
MYPNQVLKIFNVAQPLLKFVFSLKKYIFFKKITKKKKKKERKNWGVARTHSAAESKI